ncbi:hypothetical protein BRCON_1684 [Candidatus Sumerlaea chitinivorans]|uniref:Uncharacterized protein n=1 Tax=Sumerlaea chitinivorans TaxID=2250252 RepID=A0A2Z4Y5F9_SUMC1|nr:hypothetical protein BRCON_1684 [Candidatus Sumerlaea chitinivorans]
MWALVVASAHCKCVGFMGRVKEKSSVEAAIRVVERPWLQFAHS